MHGEYCKKKFGFVVLHYMAYDMTVECVDNLLQRFKTYNINIVVVDNASSNGSGKKLADKYHSEKKVTVLLNKKNDGFARGNNIGYRNLVGEKNSDYIIVMNNDVIIEQNEFLNLIDAAYSKEQFAVLGPDIYCPAKNEHQNPAHLTGFSVKDVKSLYDTLDKYSRHPAYYYYKHAIFGKLKRKIKGEQQTTKETDWTLPMENVVLHGACYIFSEDFIAKRIDCFNPHTFLYMEEDILHYECMRDGLKMVYDPLLKIKHFEDVSTNTRFNSGYKKFKMKNEQMKKSIDVMLKEMEDKV